MSDPTEQNSDGVRERRLANAFGLHRKIQSTLDGQEKEKQTDMRLAMIGIVLLIIIALIVVFTTFVGEDTVTVIS